MWEKWGTRDGPKTPKKRLDFAGRAVRPTALLGTFGVAGAGYKTEYEILQSGQPPALGRGGLATNLSILPVIRPGHETGRKLSQC